MKSKISKDLERKSKNTNNSQVKDNNNFLENEISIITKKIRKELNAYNKKYKNNKLDLIQTYNEYELENNRYKKINNKIDILEKDIESINKNITKIKKKKIYLITSIIKYKKLFKKSFFEQYKSLLNIGLSGPKNNCDLLDTIKEAEEEFNFYLNFLEKYYSSLEKNNVNEFIKKKNFINVLINDENLSFPDDKLIYYLSYVFQIIDLNNELNRKSKELEEEELKKNEVYTKIRNFEFLIKEQKSFIKDVKDFIDLLKNLIKKYLSYQKKYKNNLISKETLYEKIRKLQSVNIQNFEIGHNTQDDNNNIMNQSTNTVLPHKKNYKKFIIGRNNDMKTTNIQESKSQNISRNTLVDYLSKIEAPLKKQNNFEKNEISLNEIFFSSSNRDSDVSEKENISQNSDYESPVSTINITSRKKSLTNNQISSKTTIKNKNNKISKEIPVPKFSINDLNYINNKAPLKNKEAHNIYCKKKLNFYMNNEIKKSNTMIHKNVKFNAPLNKNKNITNNKTLKLPKKENEEIDINKSFYFPKNNAKSKNNRFYINKKKLFNKDISKTIVMGKSKLNLLSDEDKEPKPLYQNNFTKNSLINNIDNLDDSNIKNKNATIKQIINNNFTYEINNYYGDISKIQFDDSIQTIKDEIKQKKYLYLNKNRIKFFRTSDIKNDPNENCCISCL